MRERVRAKSKVLASAEMKQSRELISRRRGGRSRKQSVDGLRKILYKVSSESPISEGDELPKPEFG